MCCGVYDLSDKGEHVMKTFVRTVMLLLAAGAVCQAGLALAADFQWIPEGAASTTLVGEEKVAATGQAPCAESSCCGDSCCSLGCDPWPCRGIVGFAGLDAFKGISDGDHPSNFGGVTGLNASIPVPGLSDYGIGWQLGMSYGVYDLYGSAAGDNPAQSQQQIFLTTGFFHKAQGDRRLSFGLVYDWMINNNWGEEQVSPTLGQWRGQVEYAVSGSNAFGLWGCVRDHSSAQYVVGTGTVSNRAISQVNLFWHHKFETGADSWLWAGMPERERLSGDGSLGDWMIGANLQVPLSDRLALYANGSYFRPSQSAGAQAAVESGLDVGMGVVWYFGGHAVSHSINGARGLPYMPVANNSTFLVDQN
jgi:hypothetical protein